MLLRIITATLATGCFAILFNTDKKYLLYCSIGGGIGCFVYELCLVFHYSTYTSIFFAAIGFATYSEGIARIKRATATTFAICALLPLVPGSGMYQMMIAFVNNNMDTAFTHGLQTLSYAGLLALGILLVSTFAKLTKKPI